MIKLFLFVPDASTKYAAFLAMSYFSSRVLSLRVRPESAVRVWHCNDPSLLENIIPSRKILPRTDRIS